ncbi:GNAT family N-acetyltransferase [Geomicrobium sp. JCM 19038]|uniref:GNAT family N-acetyltransferase n=1 Tax=Geomicrobium sp. JCM 19038 TaxID=1460635 RepID=UPI00045F1CD6|nr:GNAT family N-acetyltransferase [Geomicrobium sp. JCM 19038]GAK08830.1 acetyltransferase, GNAT family [Geomicrobium sp. JCM 19038]
MQLCRLDHTNTSTAKDILSVQCPAYKEESKIIGFDGIPYLNDNIDTIMMSQETFIGCYDDHLLGFIAYEKREDHYQITRLCVVPTHFRKGVASRLVDYILTTSKSGPIHVQTGSLNTPAIDLYRRFGFVHDYISEAEPGVWLQCLVRH